MKIEVLCCLFAWCFVTILCRDEDKIMKACYWPNEVYEPCYGGCAEVSCDNPRNRLRPCYPYCEPGCVCEEPYVRDDRTHQCVLPIDCSITQMGIPVSNRKIGAPSHARENHDPYRLGMHSILSRHMPQGNKHAEYQERVGDAYPRHEEYRRDPETAKLGNYYNILHSPPSKALQKRKAHE